MTVSIDIESQGRHQYVVRLRDDDELCESWFNLTPTLLEHLGVDADDEPRAGQRTAEFLVDRQGVRDFPEIVELEDVIATYEDFAAFMSQ